MAIRHNGKSAPELPEAMDPSDDDVFWVSWTDKLNGETIASSTWQVPATFTASNEQENTTVTDDAGVEYADANSVQLSTTETDGRHRITNQITTSGGRTLNRGFYVAVADV